ncbi:hypothetical protein I5907_20140 [Panacibacter sp. DH6]|uniref:Uncharacterized protein n=1 Tax=Panacibacter microcysteis TaxID=2793269 RepID=A0A931H045_9BACT|nr:hypothetical protein [Panacibacter microcysteis]MBG9378557.1 hypothetical protein [Panacibacter microcysteis]
MKLSEFILLSEAEKKWSVMHKAVPLARRTYPHVVVFLFQLEDYYVEAFCNVADNRIDEYRVLPDTNAIRHYLDAIPIDELLN